jgi:phosphatidylglycerophosphate synthase
MNSTEYKTAERRPIATRELAISHRAAAWLAGRGITANGISVAGMISGIMAGVAFAATSHLVTLIWLCWLLGAVFVQLRLLANMLDGMVAVRCGKASPIGELFNEIPDRVSDAATLIGLGYGVGANPALGYLATCTALFVAYVRSMGKVAGAHQEFCGPMAKPQRMATVTVVALLCMALPAAMDWRLPAAALVLIIAGGLLTALRRLSRIAAALRHR